MKRLYFAYGSNTLQERLESRVGKVEVVGVAKIRRWRLAFNVGNDIAGCVANAVMTGRQLDTIQGVIYGLTTSQIKRLDQYEGYDLMYQKVTVKAEGSKGEPITRPVMMYVCLNPMFTETDHRITPTYFDCLLKGADQYNLMDMKSDLARNVHKVLRRNVTSSQK